jgi:hypothetical protein
LFRLCCCELVEELSVVSLVFAATEGPEAADADPVDELEVSVGE